MKADMARISTIVAMIFLLGCDLGRVRPVECIRFTSNEKGSLTEIIAVLTERTEGFTSSNYRKIFTERQKSAGEEWFVLRKPPVEVSLRSHDIGSSDVCVYNHGGNKQGEQIAREVLKIAKNYLREKGIRYENL